MSELHKVEDDLDEVDQHWIEKGFRALVDFLEKHRAFLDYLGEREA